MELPALRAELAGRWAATVGTGEAEAALGEELLERWSEGHRRYHTLEHLAAVLATLDHVLATEPGADRDAVVLAAWFHDAIYDPTRGDNEERSAALAEFRLPDVGLSDVKVAAVARLVRMTAHHDPDGIDAQLLSDADLVILASDSQGYDHYVASVREEFVFVADEAWAVGRARVLESLLGLPVLFHTAALRPLESRARANIERELDRLRDVRSEAPPPR